ncbi:aladin-like isoform X2 [Ostrea edulis]|uniref:aladin-like isoform X2 n=1 Tax=Ostrea edulis TaxID=37623 RepID=UPI0024AF830F|nr:aladin-like isoform X2 [Ostrea edulis]
MSESSIFDVFPPMPSDGKVTVCEQNGQLISVSSSSKPYKKPAGYPEVNISGVGSSSLTHRENAKSAFLPHDETVWKRALHAWYEMGTPGVFEEIVNSSQDVPEWVGVAAKKTLTFMSNEEIITKFSDIVNWPQSPVRAFAWHPHTLKFAYALGDDSIKVHSGKNDLVPILKHKLQKNVADIAWQPQSASVLAIAGQSCVLIWHVEPTSLATRPSTSSCQVLHRTNHAPVTCLAWDPSGRILLSSSPVDTSLMAWDVPMETCVPLRRLGGGGVSLLRWSPDGSKVFSATPSQLFRVWETKKWSCEVWTKCTSRCKAACWSPEGKTLLFATENEPIIYSLTFSTSIDDTSTVIGGSQSAVVSVNLRETEIATEDGTMMKIGGCVQNMVMDRHGERLAVTLHDDKGNVLPYIALFRTKINPLLEITPCGLIQGETGEFPQHISFQPNYDKGALLSIVWSSGALQYVPLYFIPSDEIQNASYHQPPLPNMNGHLLSPIPRLT